MTAVFFNPLDAGYMDDPYPHFADLRAADPVHRSLVGHWILFRYDDVFSLLRDPSLSVDEANVDIHDQERVALFEAELGDDLEDFERTSILGIDPPDHTRLRRLISKAFTPRRIEALRPRIEELVDASLDRLGAAGGGDVVAELAFPLPFDVISEMLGMPAADKDAIRDWSGAIVKTLDPMISEEEVRAAVRADREMHAHIDGVIAWKREHPGDDLLTAMIDVEEGGDRMSTQELRDQVTLLFIAGHETTVNLIGGGIASLIERPDQATKMIDPDADAAAIDELLRFVSPVQFSRRITLADTAIGDTTIEKGSFVLACLGSANHDPDRFGSDADELDLDRADAGHHLAFGSGIHYCLGAALAKLEGQIAIGSFLRRFPGARVTERAWNGRLNLRGLDRLEVTV